MPNDTIVELVGRRTPSVHTFDEIDGRHSTRGLEEGRVYNDVVGERQELLGNYRGAATVLSDGDHYGSEDFS